MSDISIDVHPEIKRLCDQYDVRPVLLAALEAMRQRAGGQRLTAQSIENLLVCDQVEFLATKDGGVLVRLIRGERLGLLHFEDDIARFDTRRDAAALVRRYRADLVEGEE